MKDKNKEDKEPKLPMYYEQVNSLMKCMAKAFMLNKGDTYVRIFRQLYVYIRPNLKEDRKKYYDEIIKKQCSPYTCYKLEIELFQDIETQTDIFKVLKSNVEELELRGE